MNSWQGPVSIRVISTSGVSPISERMAGGLTGSTGSTEEEVRSWGKQASVSFG